MRLGSPIWLQCRVFSPLLVSHGSVLVVWTFWLYLFSILMFVVFLGAPIENLLGFFTGFTCWRVSGYTSTIGTLGGYAWLGV